MAFAATIVYESTNVVLSRWRRGAVRPSPFSPRAPIIGGHRPVTLNQFGRSDRGLSPPYTDL